MDYGNKEKNKGFLVWWLLGEPDWAVLMVEVNNIRENLSLGGKRRGL